MDRQHLLDLATRCEAGADQLTYEGEHAAEVLADRGHPDADPAAWAVRKAAAAQAAREYAQGLRDQAAGMSDTARPTEARVREAERVADAANLGGILIDGRPMAATQRYRCEEQAQAAQDHARAKADQIEATGAFEHVAETINGVKQVPFWQLGHTTQTADDPAAAPVDRVDDDTVGM
jgi:hypothetical protein